jgi:hypothetical protein
MMCFWAEIKAPTDDDQHSKIDPSSVTNYLALRELEK